MATIDYNANSKLISIAKDLAAEPSADYESLEINVNQINRLTKGLIETTNPNFTPEPNAELSKVIKGLFDTGMKNIAQQKKLPEALKNISLAIDTSTTKRYPWEAFAIQLQELQFMLRQKVDLELVTLKYLDAIQDLDMLLNTGMIHADVFLRKTDALLRLKQWELARIECERGLSLDPKNPKLNALMLQCVTLLAEYNGDI
ncbi:hypothetical protein TBLA_0E00990 [Henningerozyma blattae CBS 6284]|uniref:Translocation protein SEC72 n=1 Tax=Henningerozyma blattae (strain ATCC 34711 / CBS 6284 / DSM 70876 / NBRC 10599 / NRRL Y-10934 / UCD 77-7) TaxID=1071380 RepID=I2H457_HENB6|nr:hypothetical protein TBLA_0E00990 [Tetrapisispora blattae CBS 6284]CCH61159.1 hypothetical protein TBLA_0E00990 [Tetrapisispora blattae CBS 6284]